MEELVSRYGWQLAKYPIEIAANTFILYFVLNRMTPPQYDIKILDESDRSEIDPVMKRRVAYPLIRCLGLSASLFIVFMVTMFCLTLPFSFGYAGFIVINIVLAIVVWWFGSKLVIGVLFRMPRGQIVILVLYIVSSLTVEAILKWAWGLF